MGMKKGMDTTKRVLNKYDRTIKRNIKKTETQKEIVTILSGAALVLSLFFCPALIILYIVGTIIKPTTLPSKRAILTRGEGLIRMFERTIGYR